MGVSKTFSPANNSFISALAFLALEAATREPEHSIYVLPFCLDNSPVPDRLAHLHVVNIEEPTDLLGEKYLAIQQALMVRAAQLRDKYDSDNFQRYARWGTGKTQFLTLKEKAMVYEIPYKTLRGQRPFRLTWEGDDYLVRGRNPDGGTYVGIGRLEVNNNDDAKLDVEIGVHFLSYQGTFDGVMLELKGSHDVNYQGRAGTSLFLGAWGDTGFEELIVASPFAKRIKTRGAGKNRGAKPNSP